MREIVSKNKCVGCGLCSNICPKQCINMENDREGFWYPEIEASKCVDCGLCKQRCPIQNETVRCKVSSYWAKIRDKELLQHSSSGGVFSWAAKKILEAGGVVFGARYDEDMHVYHDYIERIEDLYLLQKSKYVQSDIAKSYKDCQKFLDSQRQVLFVGTPCQIAGLKAYIKGDVDNLLTMDLICSGVASPKVWDEYLKYLRKRKNEKIVNIDMRDKRHSWERFNFSVSYYGGEEYTDCYSNDLYCKAFINKLINRPSCYDCKFVGERHLSDFTIGDLWGMTDILGHYDDEGSSVIIANSEKGQAFFDRYNNDLIWQGIDYEKVKKYNWPLARSAKMHARRKRFFNKMNNDIEIEIAIKEALRYTLLDRVKSKIKRLLHF